jgi:hypothetical protein
MEGVATRKGVMLGMAAAVELRKAVRVLVELLPDEDLKAPGNLAQEERHLAAWGGFAGALGKVAKDPAASPAYDASILASALARIASSQAEEIDQLTRRVERLERSAERSRAPSKTKS